MAEAVFQHKVALAGLDDRIETDSAGTGSWHVGNPPHEGTRAILREKGIDYRHRARVVRTADLDEFDYIVTMDDDNLRNVLRLGSGKAIVKPFLDYAPGTGYTEVPDPYYTGRFAEVYDLVDIAADGLLATIRRERGL